MFLCGGLANALHVSFLVAAMSMGFVVARFASHHERPFHAIEGVEWPFMILFFLLAGNELRLQSVMETGTILLAYVAARALGRFVGTRLGVGFAAAPSPEFASSMGLALMPQAGVALGMGSSRRSEAA